MGKRTQAFDEYIDKAQPFAQPILTLFRDMIHDACPECEEKLKWGMPHYDYKGMMLSTASFKEHCILNFWKAPLLDDPHQVLEKGQTSAMGQLGRIKHIEELPLRSILEELIDNAVQLNNAGILLPKKTPKQKEDILVPDDFQFALTEDNVAKEVFDNFTNGQRKEYIEWVTDAKRDATRQKRIATAVMWIAAGKRRNWKYEKC